MIGLPAYPALSARVRLAVELTIAFSVIIPAFSLISLREIFRKTPCSTEFFGVQVNDAGIDLLSKMPFQTVFVIPFTGMFLENGVGEMETKLCPVGFNMISAVFGSEVLVTLIVGALMIRY